MQYPQTQLFIGGQWRNGSQGQSVPVFNPATGEQIGHVAAASAADLDDALQAAQQGFDIWKNSGALQRSDVLRAAAALMRQHVDETAQLLTLEQGKPLAESQIEILHSAELLDWFAEEARRSYGRSIPARASNVQQLVIRVPIGPVVAFTPWNFPISQTVRKIGAALASGCSIIVKPPEEAPAAIAQLAQFFQQSGLPAGVLNFVYGNPAAISAHLIPSPIIRKVSFTGSLGVGKHLAALAAQGMKPCTMELGGHAPVIVTPSADVAHAAALLCKSKFRNGGQVCVSPTRFLVHEKVHDEFVEHFVREVSAIRVGSGLDSSHTMGPLINERRVQAIEDLVNDALAHGAQRAAGGRRMAGPGSFFEPTVLTGVNTSMRLMHEEPFGPIASVIRYSDLDEALTEANRLAFGLASYAFSSNAAEIACIERELQVGMLSINHLGLALPETPFGGVKDSGYGSEGGTEAMDAYLKTRFITKCLA